MRISIDDNDRPLKTMERQNSTEKTSKQNPTLLGTIGGLSKDRHRHRSWIQHTTILNLKMRHFFNPFGLNIIHRMLRCIMFKYTLLSYFIIHYYLNILKLVLHNK